MSNFFAIPITDEWGTTYQLTTAGYTALVVLMLALLLLACFIGNSVKQPKFSARQLAFSAMAIAAAFVTSEIKLFHLPFGGSITLFSMLFLVLIGYWYGLRAGLLTMVFRYYSPLEFSAVFAVLLMNALAPAFDTLCEFLIPWMNQQEQLPDNRNEQGGKLG